MQHSSIFAPFTQTLWKTILDHERDGWFVILSCPSNQRACQSNIWLIKEWSSDGQQLTDLNIKVSSKGCFFELFVWPFKWSKDDQKS